MKREVKKVKSKARAEAAKIAREAWSLKKGFVSVRRSFRIPAKLQSAFESQDNTELGSLWADGYLINRQIGTLYLVLNKLSGCGVSHIIDKDVTLVIGQQSFTADTQIEAILKAIAHFLPMEKAIGETSDFDLEQRLNELGILE